MPEKFLDELLIWRELAHNFCFHQQRPEILDGLPKWNMRDGLAIMLYLPKKS